VTFLWEIPYLALVATQIGAADFVGTFGCFLGCLMGVVGFVGRGMVEPRFCVEGWVWGEIPVYLVGGAAVRRCMVPGLGERLFFCGSLVLALSF